MTYSADFTLNGTPQSDGGYIAEAGGTVDLALADGMAIDAGVVVVSLERMTKDANNIAELATDYTLSPPSATLTLTIPDEVSSWLIRVQLNGGSDGRGVQPTWTRERIIATLGPSGVRKMIPGESTEFDPTIGWSETQNDEVDALDALANGDTITPPASMDPFTGLSVTSEYRADVGVEHGYRVARWLDRRGPKHMGPIESGLTTNKRPIFDADFGDGFPVLDFALAAVLVSQLPLVTSDRFSIALRVQLPATDVTVLSVVQAYPNGDPDASRFIIAADYIAGANTSITASITDDAATTPVVASQSGRHSEWRTVIVRSNGTTIGLRVDGVNGSTASTVSLGASVMWDTTAIGTARDASDGSAVGDFTGGYLRHILVADGLAWTDAECLTVEAAFTEAWT